MKLKKKQLEKLSFIKYNQLLKIVIYLKNRFPKFKKEGFKNKKMLRFKLFNIYRR